MVTLMQLSDILILQEDISIEDFKKIEQNNISIWHDQELTELNHICTAKIDTNQILNSFKYKKTGWENPVFSFEWYYDVGPNLFK